MAEHSERALTEHLDVAARVRALLPDAERAARTLIETY